MSSPDTRYRQRAPQPVATEAALVGTDEDYDYTASKEERAYQQAARKLGGAPPPPPPPGGRPRASPPKPEQVSQNHNTAAEDPLLDLEQLEELHEEAERMKALGNKHMAAQEYTRAYNAYSAALQLSPVGPSSHVFLCNRAAALLSLKRYAAAATDARRAIALAPTFGKSHARLGQSLYFLKDYEGAVAAYEEAIKYEPDNEITKTYLEKAKSKLARQHERARRQARGEELSVAEDSVAYTVANSIATDPHASAAVVTAGAVRGNQKALMAAAGRLPHEVSTGGPSLITSPLAEEGAEGDFELPDDPDFDEAVKVQERANKLLAAKRYKEAIQEYSSALFLVPDDPYLSPELHLGRAHALNGSHRHESARNDALLAIKINPTSEAYSTLAKSLFYMKDYLGAVAAYEDCMDLLPQGESLSMFDQAYLRKAEAAWQEELETNPDDVRSLASGSTKTTPIPKLPPPRFVPREKAINSTPNMPPMPKRWPQQSPRSPSALQVGPERNVSFLSESLGIKLNRGADGIVRVLSVSPETPSSPIARSGTIEVGDVVREAAGVDIRRPITNIMWGDTVALIKIAPRPITLVVAKELSEVPPAVLEERERAAAEEAMSPASRSTSRGEMKEPEDDHEGDIIVMPSPANGEESVQDSVAMGNEKAAHATAGASRNDHSVSDTVDASSAPALESVAISTNVNVDSLDSIAGAEGASADQLEQQPELVASSGSMTSPDVESGAVIVGESHAAASDTQKDVKVQVETKVTGVEAVANLLDDDDTASSSCNDVEGQVEREVTAAEEADTHPTSDEGSDHKATDDQDASVPCLDTHVEEQRAGDDQATEDADAASGPCSETREEEQRRGVQKPEDSTKSDEQIYSLEEETAMIGGEILFERRGDDLSPNDWSNLRWLSTSGERKLRFCRHVTRIENVRKGFFRKGEQQLSRKLAIYENPNLILILRPSKDTAEVRKLLDLPDGADLDDISGTQSSFLVAESVIDPITCNLRLSQLTTVTSVGSAGDDNSTPRRKSCLELVAPTETISLSALSREQEADVKHGRSRVGGPAFLETASLENSVAESLYRAHSPHAETHSDLAWKHQIVRGTLHSYVLSGNNSMLEKAIRAAVSDEDSTGGSTEQTKYVRPQIIDAVDESGRTALHYACLRKASTAVSLLTRAGASCAIPVNPGGFFPVHLSALVHDEKSLSIILSASHPMRPNPNQLDSLCRTPMYLAAVEGKDSTGVRSDGDSLGKCLSALEAWGGELIYDGPIILRNPVSVLASRWQPGEIAAVLAHVAFRYPLENAGLPMEKHGISLGASFQYPVHSALITLRDRVQMVGEDNGSHDLLTDDNAPECPLLGTLRVLLEHGFEPNERLEGVTDDFEGAAEMSQYIGYAPLQILAAAALDFHSLPSSVPAELEHNLVQMIAGAAELLVRNGARLTLDPPPASRLTRSVSSISGSASMHADDEAVSKVDRESLKIEGNKTLIGLLGGEERLSEAKQHWSELKSVHATRKLTILKKASKVNLNDSDAPGGSDEKSCAICWKEFGAIRNRKHKCRVTLRYVCDECSSKRVSDGTSEHRVSDGQFCLAEVDAARGAREATEKKKEESLRRLEKARAKRQAGPSEEDNRDSLFGGMMEQASARIFGEEEEDSRNQLEGLAGKMSQTKDALNERGDKLNSLSEKTSQLVDSSHEFAKMAKELERSQNRGLFW